MSRASRVSALLLVTACVHTAVAPVEPVGATLPVSGPSVGDTVSFDFASLDDRPVSAPAFRGKPSVIAFVTSDSLAGQAEVDILAALAKQRPGAANYAFVAVEPADRRELVVVFQHFFEEKTGVSLPGAMCDSDTLIGQGPFGDVRGLAVVILDRGGRIALRRTGLVSAADIARALESM